MTLLSLIARYSLRTENPLYEENRMVLLSLMMTMASLANLPTAATSPNCSRFLAGHWVGKGTVTGFGKPVKVDNDYTYNADGTFAAINRYLGADGRWHEQKLAGTWKASAAKKPGHCSLSLTGTGTSSSSTFEIIDRNTFRSLGFDMRRVFPQILRTLPAPRIGEPEITGKTLNEH